MTTTSLSLTFIYNNTADMARARGAATPAPATPPVTAPSSTASTACDHHGYEAPRRSPLYRALMDALENLVAAAPTLLPGTAASTPMTTTTTTSTAPAAATPSTDSTAATTPDGTAPAAPATTAANETPVAIDEAVMNFARALMQALRGAMNGDGASDAERHGHHHRHHDHGRRAWGDPAQRIAQLGSQVGAGAATQPVEPAPAAAPPVVTAAASSAGMPATPVLSDNGPDPAAATPSTPAADTSSRVVHVTLAISGPAAPALTRTQQALLDAFGTLQTARGKPKAEDEDDQSLRAQLSAFLQELADELRLGDENTADATQPGALLHVTA